MRGLQGKLVKSSHRHTVIEVDTITGRKALVCLHTGSSPESCDEATRKFEEEMEKL